MSTKKENWINRLNDIKNMYDKAIPPAHNNFDFGEIQKYSKDIENKIKEYNDYVSYNTINDKILKDFQIRKENLKHFRTAPPAPGDAPGLPHDEIRAYNQKYIEDIIHKFGAQVEDNFA